MNNTKLIRLSTAMSMLCSIMILAVPLTMLWFWLNFESNIESLAIAEYNVLQIESIQTWQIICAAIYSIGTALLVSYALLHLKSLFNNFKHGHFFTEASVASLHRFCLALCITVVSKVISTPILSVLLTLNNGPNETALIINLGSNEVWAFFAAATVLVIAWSFKEGLSLAKENASFV